MPVFLDVISDAGAVEVFMEYVSPPDDLNRELVFDFFWKFSVFEYALKRTHCLRAGRNSAAEADWDKFAAKIRGSFGNVTTPGFTEAVDGLRRLSPKRQVVVKCKLDWQDITQGDGEADEAYIIRLLRQVRNNLFHGGKYPNGPIEEVARNTKILSAAMTVLDGCYELHRPVQAWIDEAAQAA